MFRLTAITAANGLSWPEIEFSCVQVLKNMIAGKIHDINRLKTSAR
jgi:hypothetical protein